MDLTSALQLPEELPFLWHTHRTEVLLSAGILLAIARLLVHWRSRQRQAVLAPRPGVSTDEKAIPSPPSVKAGTEHDTLNPHVAPPAPTPRAGPKRVTGSKQRRLPLANGAVRLADEQIQPMIFYYSLRGATKAYAERLAGLLGCSNNLLSPVLLDVTEVDYDDFFISPPKSTDSRKVTAYFYLLLIPSYNIDTDLSNFLSHLQETHHDFRIDTAPLAGLAGYSVFGLGDRQQWPTEQQGFCTQAIEVDKWMAKLTGGRRAFPLGLGDVRSDAQQRLQEWAQGVGGVTAAMAAGRGLGDGVPGSGDAAESGDEAGDEVEDEEETTSLPKTKRKPITRSRTDDVEDIRGLLAVDFTAAATDIRKPTVTPSEPKPMVPVTSPTYTSLTKQGYTIVGTHSGVKICRWTKSALRGRGSCYKFSFYGIASHLCMEATPSLSCSNKCVFCWRHGTNPVGTTWRWQVDAPELIFEGIKEGHYKKIKMMKGVPGVRAERFQEAMKIRHCALSLVGEPIFYPHINALLGMLHKEHISSFLVCNAQHPDQLAALGPVTQLYVSIDASNKESLRRIDRPLHRDFWERFLRCMDILREKRNTHRTVFRLTLVKGFNIEEEAEGYADLVERALPSFVEVKGVTYCGTTTAAGAGLSMQNVPFYDEVSAFVLALEAALKRRGLGYGLAAEHAHSCCILLADRTRYYKRDVDGKERWHTLIDYTKFFELMQSGETFGPEDYIGAPTAEWALWGQGGFDPRDVRVDRKGKPRFVEAG